MPRPPIYPLHSRSAIFLSEVESGFKNRPDLLALYGPTLLVDIGLDPDFRPENQQPPNLPAQALPALVDTGASESCIDADLATELGLPIVDRKPVAGVHGSDELNYHVAHLYVPDLQLNIYGVFAGVHLRTGGQPHSALLGRSFLRRCTMTYRGRDGVVEISSLDTD